MMKRIIIVFCLFFVFLMVGCGGEEKKENYYYECILNSDCLPGQICINGQCKNVDVDVENDANIGLDVEDASTQDASQDVTDVTSDAGADAIDAGKDISQEEDIMTDSNTDAGEDVIDNDAGADAGDAITSDAIEDISADVGEDTGADVIEDANVDVGPSDAGCSSCEIIFANPCGEAKDDFILRSIPDFRTVAEGECIAESCQIVFDCSKIGDYFQVEFSCEANKKWLCNSWQNKSWIDPQNTTLRICGAEAEFEAVEAFGGGNCHILNK